MSLTLPPPADPPAPVHLIQDHARRRRWRPALVLASAGIGLSLLGAWILPHLNIPLTPTTRAVVWLAGLGTALLSLAWSARHTTTLDRSARELDARLRTRNRLEAAAELAGDESPLARAQRQETSTYLHHTPQPKRPPSLLPWWTALALLLFAHLGSGLLWLLPHLSFSQQPGPPAEGPPQASIRWISPEAEIKATAIEEIPLRAESVSTSGLKNPTLEISVNGAPRRGLPLPAEKLAQPGRHLLTPSLFLDELDLQPFDIVSYHIQAERIHAQKFAATTSPVQFVQIRPAREEISERPGGNGSPGQAVLAALKVAQLRALKENFLLAHTDLAPDNPVRTHENDRVAREQKLLVEKTEEAITLFTQEGAPAEVINLLRLAQEQMDGAASAIATAKNQAALIPQGAALARITEIEKFFRYSISRDGSSPPSKQPEVRDPFKRPKPMELKQRFETAAGLLELLAQEQTRLADDINRLHKQTVPEPPADSIQPLKVFGTADQRQTQIAQGMASVENSGHFADEAARLLASARVHAATSLNHLAADDWSAAREPATSAARDLQRLLQLINQQGEDQKREAMAEVQMELNRAADTLDKATAENDPSTIRQAARDAARTTAELQDKLQQEAQQQQESGSANAADELHRMAQALADAELQNSLTQAARPDPDTLEARNASEQLRTLAERAAKAQSDESALPAELQRLIDQIERQHVSLERIASRNRNSPQTDSQQGQQGEETSGSNDNSGGPNPGGSGPGPGSRPSNESTNPGNNGSRRTDPNNHDTLTTELLQDLANTAQVAETTFSEDPQLGANARRIREEIQEYLRGPRGNTVDLVETLRAPTRELLNILRAKLASLARDQQLIEDVSSEAPEGYREAVARYFEELSKDYQKPEPDAPSPGAAPIPSR